MIYKEVRGFMDIGHVFLVITLVALVIALLIPFHFNIKNIENTILMAFSSWNSSNNNSSNNGNNYVVTNTKVIQSNDLTIISVTIRNNENSQLVIGGETTIGSTLCNLEPSIVIPPNSEGTISILIYTVNATAMYAMTVNLDGNAYSSGTPNIFCYSTNTLNTLRNNPTITFTTNYGKISVDLNHRAP